MYEPNRMFLSLKSLHNLNICPMAHLKYIFYGGESCDIYVPPTKSEGGHIGSSADPGRRRRRDSLYPPYF